MAEAKYKPKSNIYGRDYLQLLAYMLRFEAKTGYYFYPTNKETTPSRFYLNQGLTYEGKGSSRDDISVIKHGLFIPQDATSYANFIDKIAQSEVKWLRALDW